MSMRKMEAEWAIVKKAQDAEKRLLSQQNGLKSLSQRAS